MLKRPQVPWPRRVPGLMEGESARRVDQASGWFTAQPAATLDAPHAKVSPAGLRLALLLLQPVDDGLNPVRQRRADDG